MRPATFLVISAGTRNHFGLDLGLGRENPAACLDALTDGVEQRIDLGVIGDRTFVNNASFGAYAEVVRNPAYGTTSGARAGDPGRDRRGDDHDAYAPPGVAFLPAAVPGMLPAMIAAPEGQMQ